jgi:hypothetical protein
MTIHFSFAPPPLVIEQPLFAPQSTAIAAERSVGANDAMTRNDNANHVCAIGASDSASGVAVAKTLRHP